MCWKTEKIFTVMRRWKRIGVLCLLVAASYMNAYKSTYIRANDLEKKNAKKMKRDTTVTELIIEGCSLDNPIIKENIGEWFPNMKEVWLDGIIAPAIAPTKGDASGRATQCKNVKKVVVRRTIGSPTLFEWISLLFPGAAAAFFSLEALPVHTLADTAICRERSLMMENVKTASIRRSDSNSEVPCLLFENLRLFPNLEKIVIEDIPPSAIEEIQETDVVLSSVKHIEWSCFPGDQALLSRLPAVFPSLESIELGEAALEAAIAAASKRQEGMPALSFENITKLKASSYEGPIAAVFSERLVKVFPSLSHIELAFYKTKEILSPEDIKPLKYVRTVTVSTLIDYPPCYLPKFFPELESLIMPGCRLWRLSNCALSADGEESTAFEHPHLKHLDISGNPFLNGILVEMVPVQLKTRVDPNSPEYAEHNSPSTLSSIAYSKAVESVRPSEKTLSHVIKAWHVPPVGGLHLPELQFLDICDSFTRKLPRYFFNGCPRIKTLRISFKLEQAENTSDWWDCLEMLSELALLDVEIDPFYSDYQYSLQKEQGFSGNTAQDILKDLSTALNKIRDSRPAPFEFRLFNSSSLRLITSEQS